MAVEARPGQEAFVTLVPRDPDWALVLWELDADAVAEARAQLAEPLLRAEMQVRVYPVGKHGRRRPVRSYRVGRWSGQRLVLLEQRGVAHQAAIGFLDAQGAFVPVARSAVVVTPRGGYAASEAGEEHGDE